MAIPFFSSEPAKPRYRYIAKSTQPVAAGKHKIQVAEGIVSMMFHICLGVFGILKHEFYVSRNCWEIFIISTDGLSYIVQRCITIKSE